MNAAEKILNEVENGIMKFYPHEGRSIYSPRNSSHGGGELYATSTR